ncbi:MAG: valine--tRNA ligase [Alkalibacterium gilvum]|uniref:Valine--tRNA ligase n=1 Tax=Alkalibacterium gilvum TaxID=1130080 RepID=A0A1H6UTS0_9LACT|nr:MULTISPECIES: valine--tRNA ligase [Alkalibacterium]MDN6293225.1 valine--tRNA ligase [Alkalibacterium sp.]MDN6295271.1 valine--tRNA ligase [Alkalibacterium sp.]MDN6397911.1 valine--tRNA ligase [Alkalibacterium sp.]SEI93087.1 valyl-tRNA synthetase [Alkalibacterium gilvum]
MEKPLNMSKKYEPSKIEEGRYEKWLREDLFRPDGKGAEPYSVVIPPPNVTGKLHLGHAWDTTLQDIIIRQKRMQGYDALWLPGMDHAGIATQAKVEEKLAQDSISKYDLGREKFLEKVWEWKEEYAENIRSQWSKVGISVDYSRERFTLDEGLNNAVNKVFVDLYKKDLIYRGEYIINWDPKAQTALSDIEVDHKDVSGAFYHVKYPIVGEEGEVEIATTRPETMLGDTAVAVHPEDERYQHLIGKKVLLPILEKELIVVADDYVDREFGTGVVKITPAHDPNDFEIGKRHDLEQVNVMNKNGSMNEHAGKYNGMDRFEARKALVKDLKEDGYLIKVEEMTHSVGHSERTGVIVEPRLSTQWFVKMQPLAEQALSNQKTEDKVDFVPERFEKTFNNWMENVHDWVISRQLWWGHRIPAWYHKETGELYVGESAPTDSENWEQDSDVLDTWFSSALWPFSTMGWPDTDAEDFKKYFPTSTLVTGYDIIFFWISRMIFQSLEFTGKAPFKNVLIHGLIRDEQGRKMSKSLGNGIDPMEVIDQYGADALRWFLSNGSAPGQDVRFSYEKMDAAWNFINKIWNASRYVIMNLDNFSYNDIDLSGEKTIADKWILARLNQTIEEVTELFEKFEFGEAGRKLYTFIWDDYCDWYIEMSKELLIQGTEKQKTTTKSVLIYVLDQTLRLLHPIMPFVTEEIWENIPHSGDSLVVADYPEPVNEFKDQEAMLNMEMLIELIRSVRSIRLDAKRPLSKEINILIKTKTEKEKAFLQENRSFIERFCNPNELVIDTEVKIPEEVKSAVISGAEVYIPLAGLVDIEQEIERLEQEKEKWQEEINRVDKKLANKKFVENAPDKIVEAEKEKGRDYKEKFDAVAKQIDKLKNVKEG